MQLDSASSNCSEHDQDFSSFFSGEVPEELGKILDNPRASSSQASGSGANDTPTVSHRTDGSVKSKRPEITYKIVDMMKTGKQKGFRIAVSFNGEELTDCRVMVSGQMGDSTLVLATRNIRRPELANLIPFLETKIINSYPICERYTETITVENYTNKEQDYLKQTGFKRSAAKNMVYHVSPPQWMLDRPELMSKLHYAVVL